MSDHGFEAKSTKDVHINDWLRINGYLKTKKEVKFDIVSQNYSMK